MRSRIAVAVFASLVAGGLAHGQQPAAAPTAPAPAVTLGPGAIVSPDAPVTGVFPDGACGDCEEVHICGPRGRFWAEADFLWWWMKGSPTTALVTTSPASTLFSAAGVLGQSTTAVLFGGKPENEGERDGGRFTAGAWFDLEQTMGVEANAMLLENRTTNFSAGGGSQSIFRPFTSPNTATTFSNAAVAVNVPGVLSGRIAISSQTDGLVGAGVLFRENLWYGDNYRLDVVGGYRFQQFADRLGITENVTNQVGGLIPNLSLPFAPVGANGTIIDRFDATNDFHGFDFGLTGEYRTGPWRLRWTTKLAIGENFEIVDINGSTTVTPPGGKTTSQPGGFLALISNIGHLTRDRSIVIPEGNLQIGAKLTPHIRAWIGYTGLYWSEAVWGAKQIDPVINTQLLPPSTGMVSTTVRPLPLFEATSLWAQGLDVGLEIRY